MSQQPLARPAGTTLSLAQRLAERLRAELNCPRAIDAPDAADDDASLVAAIATILAEQSRLRGAARDPSDRA